MVWQKGVVVMTTQLLTLRAELASAARYPTAESRLLRAIVVAIDAYLAYRKWQMVAEHVQALNSRERQRA